MNSDSQFEEFEADTKTAQIEIWFLGSLFVIATVGLIWVFNRPVDLPTDFVGQANPTGIEKSTEYTRNKTPALGL